MNDPFASDPIQDEKVENVEYIGPSQYYGAIGRVYHNETKNGWKQMCVDIILIQSKVDKDSPTIKYVNGEKTESGEAKLSLLQTKDGTPITYPVIYTISFPEGSVNPRADRFFAYSKKQLAQALGAYDADNSTVQWSKIQKMAGECISFSLVNIAKEGQTRKIVVSYDSIMMLNKKVALDSIKQIYSDIADNAPAKGGEETAPSVGEAPPW